MRKIIGILSISTLLLLTPTYIYATELETPVDMTNAGLENITEESGEPTTPNDSFLIGVDENGNQIELDANITIDVNDFNANAIDGDTSIEIPEETLESSALEIEEDLNTNELITNENPLASVTPITQNVDQEIERVTDVAPNSTSSISPIVSLAVAITIPFVISLVIFAIRKKKKQD